MAKVEWIKIYTDMFNNKKIKYIRTLPEGNNILLIWIMLITMAGNCNQNGYIFLTENIPYTAEVLAKELGFETTTVKLALSALQKLNMIQISEDDLIFICGWCEYQNVEGMDKIRLQTKERVAKYRNKQKQICLSDSNVTCNVTVTEGNATEEDKERDKERDKELKDNEQIIAQIWSRYPNKKGKATAMKKLPKLVKIYGYDHIIRCIERYEQTSNFKNGYIKQGDTFFNTGYVDYLDENYQEEVHNGECSGSARTNKGTNSKGYNFSKLYE